MASKTVLITGCSADGIGAAIARSLVDRGHHVFMTARNTSKIPADLAKHASVTTLALDIKDRESIAAAAASVAASGRGLDVLVNNAGGGYAMPILDIDIDRAKDLYDLNVWAQIAVIQAFSAQLIARRGRIVNISTCAVPMHTPWICGRPRLTTLIVQSSDHCTATYVSSKAAFTSFSETLRLELAPFGVQVGTIMVGTVDSLFHVNDPFTLPPDSRYAPIEKTIAGWASGELKPKGIPNDKFAELIVDDVTGDSNRTGLIWKGPNAGSLAAMSKWAPQSICVSLPIFFLLLHTDYLLGRRNELQPGAEGAGEYECRQLTSFLLGITITLQALAVLKTTYVCKLPYQCYDYVPKSVCREI